MKAIKIFTAAALTAAFAAGSTAALASEEAREVTVVVDGAEIDFSLYDNATPFIEDGVTYVPVRAVAEGFGLDVSIDSENKTVAISGESEIILTEEGQFDASLRIVDGGFFVPLRFVCESMGATVEWNGDEYKVMISFADDEANAWGDNEEEEGHTWSISVGDIGSRVPNVETDPELVAVIEEGCEKFEQLVFEDEEAGISLEYSLYVPEDYDENEKYPLIMYIPDVTAASKTAKEIVSQYYGANIWVTEDEQAKHKCFVLTPAFSHVIVDDDYNTSEEIETAVKLIDYLKEAYSIDSDRIYATGQSMGCMTSLYLNSKYTDLFAASLFVSGQWDISVLKPLEGMKFFYIAAGGDLSSSGGQDNVMAMLDEDNIGYSFGSWSALDSAKQQNEAVSALIEQGFDINFIRFEAGTVMEENPDAFSEHNASFNYAYKIEAVRDWLFEQSK